MRERERRERESNEQGILKNTAITLLKKWDVLWFIYFALSNDDKMTHFMQWIHSVTSRPNVHMHSAHVLWRVYVYVKL